MFLNRNRHTSGIHSSKCEMMELLHVSYCRDFLPKLRRGGWVFVLNILFDAIHNLTKWAKESIIIKSCSSRVLPGVVDCCRCLAMMMEELLVLVARVQEGCLLANTKVGVFWSKRNRIRSIACLFFHFLSLWFPSLLLPTPHAMLVTQ